MKKVCMVLTGALVLMTAFAGLNSDTSTLDYPIPDAKESLHGNVGANVKTVTNITAIVSNVSSNLVKQKIQINLNNCIWDPQSKILYERTIKDNRLFYIAVTNVDLITLGLPLVRE